MRGHDKRSQGSAEPNAPCRLTMKPHHDSVPSRAHNEYRIRLYDRDHVVGYVPRADGAADDRDFRSPVGTDLPADAILLTRGYAAGF